MILLDIAPWPDERQGRVIYDTIDTIAVPLQDIANPATNGGSTATTLWTILTALVSLAICLLMVRSYRKRASVSGI